MNEFEILRAVLEEHAPTHVECGLCGGHLLCEHDFHSDWTIDHVIEEFRKAVEADAVHHVRV